MPQIPSNWQMVNISDLGGGNTQENVQEPPRQTKRKSSSGARSGGGGGGGGGGRAGGAGGSGNAKRNKVTAPGLGVGVGPRKMDEQYEVVEATKNKASIINEIVDSHADIKYRQEIHENIEKSGGSLVDREAQIEEMIRKVSRNLNTIIDMTDYKSLLEGVETKQIVYTSEIRSVSKSYEDTYLRQSVSAGERECVRGGHCECMFIDAAQPFVGVEYLLPWESAKEAGNGMCLPCIRAATQALFYDILHSGLKINGLVQKFYNEHSTEGEYKLSAMLFCPPSGPVHNLPMPVMRHQRNFYKVNVKNNIHFMEQVGVDFQLAPCM